MLAVTSVQNLYPITLSVIYTTITILCFLHWCETQSLTVTEIKNLWCLQQWYWREYFVTKHVKKQGTGQNGKFHKGADASVGALCINSKITVNVTRITFITFLLIKFLSHYMFQLERSHLQNIPFHWKHTTYYYIKFSSI
jgi:hypothetical protein